MSKKNIYSFMIYLKDMDMLLYNNIAKIGYKNNTNFKVIFGIKSC